MAGKDNLIPQNKRTKEEQREIARKGGIASGEARRKQKQFKERINLLMSLPFPDITSASGKKIRTTMQALGLSEEDIDNGMAVIISMYQEALKGNVKASEFLRDTGEGKPKDRVALEGNVNNPFEDMSTDELRKLISNVK